MTGTKDPDLYVRFGSAPTTTAYDCRPALSGASETCTLTVPAGCKEVTLTLHHTGKLPREAMGHNWVLVNAADFNAVASAGMSAGLANDYVAPGDQRVLAHTKTIGGGQTTSVTFPTSILKPGGDYRYLYTFPGHNALMRGTFKFG